MTCNSSLLNCLSIYQIDLIYLIYKIHFIYSSDYIYLIHLIYVIYVIQKIWTVFLLVISATKYRIFKLYFLLKTVIITQILNTKSFLCDIRGRDIYKTKCSAETDQFIFVLSHSGLNTVVPIAVFGVIVINNKIFFCFHKDFFTIRF